MSRMMESSAGRATKATTPFLAAAALLAPSVPASAVEREQSDKAPSAQRIAYCMKQILQKPARLSTGYKLVTNADGSETVPAFSSRLKAAPVKDKQGKHCTDVAERSIQPQVRLNGELVETNNNVSLSGNTNDSSASKRIGLTPFQCAQGPILGQGAAVIEADPVDLSMPTQITIHYGPVIKARC